MEPTQRVQQAVSYGANPVSTEGCIPEIKRSGRKADQLLSSSVKVLYQCSYAPPTPPPYMAPWRAEGRLWLLPSVRVRSEAETSPSSSRGSAD
jgi:hypothetical protein